MRGNLHEEIMLAMTCHELLNTILYTSVPNNRKMKRPIKIINAIMLNYKARL